MLKQKVWTHIRLLLEQSDVGPHCLLMKNLTSVALLLFFQQNFHTSPDRKPDWFTLLYINITLKPITITNLDAMLDLPRAVKGYSISCQRILYH